MAFKAKEKEVRMDPDCKDFKPFFFDKEHCKLTGKCANAGHGYEMHCYMKNPDLCTGISEKRYAEWLKEEYGFDRNNPPQGGSGVGYGEKPKTRRPKLKARPVKEIKIGLTD